MKTKHDKESTNQRHRRAQSTHEKVPCDDSMEQVAPATGWLLSKLLLSLTAFCDRDKLFATIIQVLYDESSKRAYVWTQRINISDSDSERVLCYPTRNVSHVDGYVFRSVTQLVKQMCCLVPEYMSYPPQWGGQLTPDPPPRTSMACLDCRQYCVLNCMRYYIYTSNM